MKFLVVVFLISFFGEQCGRFLVRSSMEPGSGRGQGDGIERHIQEINRNIPLYIDEITRIESVQRVNQTVVFNITVLGEGLDIGGVTSEYLTKAFKEDTIQRMKTNDSGYEIFRRENITLQFVYSVSGHDLRSVFTITPDEIKSSR